ncbi:MAG: right-handed parallel beta-helix repeat-containing protein [Candidatus Latescibacter sp.]|nr:right-handed parallel beta-helix repeat-containing protein [Candidatus Latescibacter sp.]
MRCCLVSRLSLLALLVVSVLVWPSAAGSAAYYVSLTGNDAWPGTRPDSAWRHIAYAATRAQAGDSVYIRGGDYGHEHVVVSNSGTSSAPIVFEGYSGMPVLNGSDRTGQGILISGKNYVTFKNIELSMYMDCISVVSGKYITLKNIVIRECGGLASAGRGIQLERCKQSTIRNCEVTDAGGVGIYTTESDSCLIDNCRVYGTRTDVYEMDYYIVMSWATGNTIRNCTTEVKVASSKGNHGIGIKDHTGVPPGQPHPPSNNNKIINCTAINFEECFFAAHGAHHNEFINCYGNNAAKGNYFNNVFMVRDGASDNTFTNCSGVGNKQVVCIYLREDYEDDADKGINHFQANNSFVNCIFENGIVGVFLRDAQNTTFRNCTFVNSTNLFRFGKNSTGVDQNSNTRIENCIIYGVTNQYDTRSLTQPYSFTSTPETGYNDMGDVTATYTNVESHSKGK